MGALTMSFEELYAKMAANIERHGRTVLGVGENPPFSYTIGNSLKHLPELIVIGLHPRDGMALLNLWSELMISQGREFRNGEIVHLEPSGAPTLALHCPPSVRARYTIQAGQYLGHQDYRVTQMVISDPSGRLPPDCDPAIYNVPLLGKRPH
jgi:hypothetical protein